jgi:hypothetical protein
VKRLIISVLLGLLAELYPLPGVGIAGLFFTGSPHDGSFLPFIFTMYISNFVIVTGAVYWVWGRFSRKKEAAHL